MTSSSGRSFTMTGPTLPTAIDPENPLRVLALIHPIENYVGHWACSSPSLSIRRLVMEGPDLETRLILAVREHSPDVIAVTSKSCLEYLHLLEKITADLPGISAIPRVFRCQNTVLHQQLGEQAFNLERCEQASGWFRLARDPRWALVLVQTLDDVEIIRYHLRPIPVATCPYGYDPALFNPDLPPLERTINVGCYMNIKGIPERARLVEATEKICRRLGFSFRFEQGVYGEAYVHLIRSTKVHLHWAEYAEVPYRMYETAVFGTVFLSNPLQCGVEQLFNLGEEYLTYKTDLSDLETKLVALLENPAYCESIGRRAQVRARQYSWPAIAEAYVAPALAGLLQGRDG